jgi:hypothetical protein
MSQENVEAVRVVRSSLPGLRVAIMLLASVGATGCGDSGPDAGFEVPTQRIPVRADPPGSPQTLEPLTPRQRRQARRILVRDSRFKRIVKPMPYRLLETIPWGTQDQRGSQPREVFIGTRSEAVLERPKPVVVEDWALNESTRGKSPAYLILTAHLTVRGLRSLAVFVDLKRRRVASMQPLKADEVIFPPGWPRVVEPD